MLEMPLFTEYFNGSNWVINSADSCSSYAASQVQFVAASYQGDLNAGETSATLPATSTNIVNGQSATGSGLWFSAPGVGNSGEVSVEFDLAPADWLTFDWDGDGNKDNPRATLGFGRYRGSDRIIYWKEN
jgi:MSHA biogenesis protein MshQ